MHRGRIVTLRVNMSDTGDWGFQTESELEEQQRIQPAWMTPKKEYRPLLLYPRLRRQRGCGRGGIVTRGRVRRGERRGETPVGGLCRREVRIR